MAIRKCIGLMARKINRLRLTSCSIGNISWYLDISKTFV